jgi:hypothetical protein
VASTSRLSFDRTGVVDSIIRRQAKVLGVESGAEKRVGGPGRGDAKQKSKPNWLSGAYSAPGECNRIAYGSETIPTQNKLLLPPVSISY